MYEPIKYNAAKVPIPVAISPVAINPSVAVVNSLIRSSYSKESSINALGKEY